MDIINSILDTDLYKLTMQYAVLKKFPEAKVRYKLIFRKDPEISKGMLVDLWNSLHSMKENAILTDKEYRWMENNLPYLPRWYLDFLGGYRFNPDEEVKVEWKENQIELNIEGHWYRVILWEVPVMATISELNFKFHEEFNYNAYGTIDRTQKKAIMFKERGIKVTEMGTRRRYSYFNQDLVIKTLKQWGGDSLLGTSNVHFAMKHRLKAFGSVAHEWYSAHGAEYGYSHWCVNCIANIKAVDNWKDVYGDNLDVGLTDTFTSKVFFKDYHSMSNKILRQDSGDPIVWGYHFMRWVDKNNEQPHSYLMKYKDRHIIFSDSLNKKRIEDICNYLNMCKYKLDYSFGIGTWLTNDIEGITPLNMVIKLVEFNGKPCVKLGDGVGKEVGDPNEVARVKKELGIK